MVKVLKSTPCTSQGVVVGVAVGNWFNIWLVLAFCETSEAVSSWIGNLRLWLAYDSMLCLDAVTVKYM